MATDKARIAALRRTRISVCAKRIRALSVVKNLADLRRHRGLALRADLRFMMFPWQNQSMSEPVTIDARGHRCPVPTLKLQKQMHAMAGGERVVLIADDPMARIDVPHFCNQNQYLLQSIEPCGTGWRFEILRP